MHDETRSFATHSVSRTQPPRIAASYRPLPSRRFVGLALVLLILAAGLLPVRLFGEEPERVVVTAEPLKNAKKPDEVVIIAPKVIPMKGQKASDLPVIRKLVFSASSDKAVHVTMPKYTHTGSNVPPTLTYYKGYAMLSGPVEVPVKVVNHHGDVYAILYLGRGRPEVVKLGITGL